MAPNNQSPTKNKIQPTIEASYLKSINRLINQARSNLPSASLGAPEIISRIKNKYKLALTVCTPCLTKLFQSNQGPECGSHKALLGAFPKLENCLSKSQTATLEYSVVLY